MNPRTRKLGLWLTIIAILTLVIGLAPSSQAATGKDGLVPSVNIGVQGRLTDAAGAPITTATNVTFSIYTAPDSINPLYTESASITPDASGLYTYLLGTNNTIDQTIVAQFSHQLYLGVTVGADAEMTPRFALSASPYALSLAPGAVASGNVSGGTNRYGTINGINELSNSSDNAGLYGKGATGVRGEAQSSGATGGYGGYFSNAGGGTGNHYGVYGQNSSSGGTTGYGGFFENFGGGSGSQAGIRANNSSSGGTSGYAGYFQNTGGGSGRQFGIYATSPGYGIFGQSSAASSQQESSGVAGNSTVVGGYGGIFTGTFGIHTASSSSGNTSGYGGQFINNGGGNNAQYGMFASNRSTGGTIGAAAQFENNGGGSGTQYGINAINNSTGGNVGYAGYFDNNGGGNGPQFGISASTTSSGGTEGYGGYFSNAGGGTGVQYGIYANTIGGSSGAAGYFNNDDGGGFQYGVNARVDADSTSGGAGGIFYGQGNAANAGAVAGVDGRTNSASSTAPSYGGYFSNSSYHYNPRYGLYTDASTVSTDAFGYSAYFNSDSATRTSVHVQGALDVSGTCCLAAGYTVKVKYNGAAMLHIGDVLAADGNNASVDGVSIPGTVRGDANNAEAALCVAQQRLKNMGKDEQGHDQWQLDEATAEFHAGDLISCVALGQARLKVAGNTHIGSRLALDAKGGLAATNSSDFAIGKVISAADKDGYVTVFVNLK